jgi:hypothetical protein
VALQQNTVNVFVEFGHPVFKIGISSQVEVNNLIINTSVNYTSHMKRERKNIQQPGSWSEVPRTLHLYMGMS